jgi:hypothetical protein
MEYGEGDDGGFKFEVNLRKCRWYYVHQQRRELSCYLPYNFNIAMIINDYIIDYVIFTDAQHC